MSALAQASCQLTRSHHRRSRAASRRPRNRTKFGYDQNGNRLSENRDGTTTALSYRANSNQLIQIGPSALTLDAAGNTTADTNGARKFYYSSAGHLQAISQYGIPVAGYLYNALGQRTGKLTLHGITLYHYDIFGRLISETTIGSQPSRDYVWAGGVPVAQINHWLPIGNMLNLAHSSVGVDGKIDWVTYLHTDALGTARLGTDVAQNVVWRNDGEAFGETAPTQTVPGGAYPVYVNLRNPGQYFDQESGLFYNGARYYNPQTGRYISSDPIGLGGGLNTYAYVGNNPLLYADPLGLSCSWCHVIGSTSSGVIVVIAVTPGVDVIFGIGWAAWAAFGVATELYQGYLEGSDAVEAVNSANDVYQQNMQQALDDNPQPAQTAPSPSSCP